MVIGIRGTLVLRKNLNLVFIIFHYSAEKLKIARVIKQPFFPDTLEVYGKVSLLQRPFCNATSTS